MQPHIFTRKADPTDLPIIVAIEHLSFSSDVFKERQFKYLLASPNAHFVVAVTNQQVVGYLILLRRKGSKRLRIYSLAIAPQFRGMGIAQHLLNYAKEHGRQQQMEIINLEVREDNHNAISLYTKEGFVLKGKRENYYQPGIHGLIMYFYL